MYNNINLIIKAGATLPYRGGQQADKYQVYASEDIRLPAQTDVQVLLGYRVNLQPHLIIHTFATAGLRHREIWAVEIHDGAHQYQSSTLQLVNLADHN